ncbi:NFATC2-interacting protein-like [Clavelina lepadiformis]|uniref:NFATC2-interacting protein-like n=1 Tax=Clavelina lepadiformis TaxID=159417 RepID=UPI0040427F6D
MSSSEEEIPQLRKRVRRRKRVISEDQPDVNLYSHKVMPSIQKVNQETAIPEKIKDLQGPSISKFRTASKEKITDTTLLYLDSSNNFSDDDDVQIVGDLSPVKAAPLTPPPDEGSSASVKKQSKSIKRKRNKLLCNVASVLLKTRNDSINQSINQDVQSVETSPTNSHSYMMVKIRFQSHVYKYPVLKTCPFKEVFCKLSEETNHMEKHFLLTLHDQRIHETDTPESLGLSVADFIDGVLMDEKVLKEAQKETTYANCINIHFQCKFEKIKKTYCINKYEPFDIAMTKYATAINHELTKLRFFFDGERIDGSRTSEDLELEDGYCIDVMRTHKK